MKQHLKNIIIDYIIMSVLGLTVFLLAGNCSQTRPHDPAVVEGLQNLKSKTITFYDSFLNDNFDEAQITEINNDFDKLISEEEKKQNKSPEYIDQAKTTKTMFNRHCEARRKSKLSKQMINYYKKNISDAFDAMISTENLRKKQSAIDSQKLAISLFTANCLLATANYFKRRTNESFERVRQIS